ncbi:hypothetical protein ABFA07_015550 [Porites harrisoni]
MFERKALIVFIVLAFKSSITATTDIEIGVLYNKASERLLRILEYVFKSGDPPSSEAYPKIPDSYQLKLRPLNVDGEDLLSKEVTSKLALAMTVIDLACNDEKAFALSSLLHVPLIKVDAIVEDTEHELVVSVRPSYRTVNKALFDVIKFYAFKNVAVLYDVRRLRQASFFYAEVREPFNAEMMPELLLLDDKRKLERGLTTLLKSHIKQVILFCDQNDLTTIMNAALYVGINDKELKWIASDLEVAGDNKTDPSICGMVGLGLHVSNQVAVRDFEQIAYKAVDDNGAKEFSLAMYAAVHDAAQVSVKALAEFLTSKNGKDIIAAHEVDKSCPLRSIESKEKGLGQKILNEIKKVKFQGLTGYVEFNASTGERLVKDGMNILNVLQNDVTQVGSWKPASGKNANAVSSRQSKEPKWLGAFEEMVKCHNPGVIGSPTVPIRTLTVTTVLERPFVEITNKSAKLKDVAGKVKDGDVQGFLIDLIRELAKEANFKYEIYLRGDTKYQNMIDELKEQKRDMALAPITITASREEDIDFSKPFMDFSLSLIMQKPGEPPINNFAFLQPFTNSVWLSTIGVVMFITIMMCVMDFLTPFGYRARARDADDEPGNEFNLLNSLWFATASILQQGPDNTPLAPSGRLLASTFWFFILILISTYTANLAAFFTIKQTADTINSLEALANQNEMKYGVMDGGSVKKFFETSENSLYRKMFSHMREYKTFVPNTTTGVKRAREENYAYITEYPYLEYHNQQKPCNTKLLNNLIQTKSYGLGLQRNSPYTNRITVAILKLREKNFIEKTRRTWWDDRSKCPKPSQSKTGNTQRLDLNNLAGVFIILLGGVVVSLVLLIIERRCKNLVDMLTNGQCRKANGKLKDDNEYVPMENIRHVEPGIKQPNVINLYPLDKYACAPESKL